MAGVERLVGRVRPARTYGPESGIPPSGARTSIRQGWGR
jgi:hypothetical protein